MGVLDRFVDWISRRHTKLVATGHPPEDSTPPTGGPVLSDELQADYGSESPAAQPPSDS
jgi:hypothetical protein